MNWKDLLKGKRMEELEGKSVRFYNLIKMLKQNDHYAMGDPLKESKNNAIIKGFILMEEETIEHIQKLLIDHHTHCFTPAQFHVDLANVDLSSMKKPNLLIRLKNALKKGLPNIHSE